MYPRIQDYFRAAIEQLKSEIESTSDQQVLGMSDEAWLNYLIDKGSAYSGHGDHSVRSS